MREEYAAKNKNISREKLIKKWYEMLKNDPERIEEEFENPKIPDPVPSKFFPSANFGACSDKFHEELETVVSKLADAQEIQTTKKSSKNNDDEKHKTRIIEKSKNILRTKYQSRIV